MQASWRVGERRKGLKFVFREHSMMSSSARVEELRWRLESLEFAEKFKGFAIFFVSSIIHHIRSFREVLQWRERNTGRECATQPKVRLP